MKIYIIIIKYVHQIQNQTVVTYVPLNLTWTITFISQKVHLEVIQLLIIKQFS